MPSPTRSRSRSPPRGPKKSSSGFRWKDKRSTTTTDTEDRSLKRGYRDRSPRRDNYRDRSPDRRDDRRTDDNYRPSDRQRDRGDDTTKRDDRRRERDSNIHPDRRRDRTSGREDKQIESALDLDAKFGRGPSNRAPNTTNTAPLPSSKPKASAASAEPLIVVTVNDRLGTKAQIPCRASDPIKLFKALVAAKIGRQPHEIMLKRQGERPFKDMLTLADYSVSNGVQLDLELDTGD